MRMRLGCSIAALLLLAGAAISIASTDEMKARARAAVGASGAADQAMRSASGASGAAIGAAAVYDEGASTDRPADPNAPPGKGAWLEYDFVPGERTLFDEDFSADAPGTFPRRLTALEGSFALADSGGLRVLRSVDGGRIAIHLPEELPERFTVEFTYHCGDSNPFTLATGDDGSLGGCAFGAYRSSAFVTCADATTQRSVVIPDEHRFCHARFSVEGHLLKAYVENLQVVLHPAVTLPRTDQIVLTFAAGSPEDPTLLGPIRIAASGRRVDDALMGGGRVTTRGLVFGPGSDQLRPESTPVLEQIGGVLKARPQFAIAIEAHADAGGTAEASQDLSERRAAAVKQWLAANFGIDTARLQARGWGAGKPLSADTTAAARRDNNRIDLIRQ